VIGAMGQRQSSSTPSSSLDKSSKLVKLYRSLMAIQSKSDPERGLPKNDGDQPPPRLVHSLLTRPPASSARCVKRLYIRGGNRVASGPVAAASIDAVSSPPPGADILSWMLHTDHFS